MSILYCYICLQSYIIRKYLLISDITQNSQLTIQMARMADNGENIVTTYKIRHHE